LAEYHEDGMPYVSFSDDSSSEAQRPAVHVHQQYCVYDGPQRGRKFVGLLVEAAAACISKEQRVQGSISDVDVGDEEEESGWLTLSLVAAIVAQANNQGTS